MTREEHPHAQGSADGHNCLAQGAVTDNTQCRAGEIAERVVKEAILRRLLPTAGSDRISVATDAATQCEDQSKRTLGNGMERLVARIANNNAMLVTSGQVNVVGSGRCDGNQLQAGR